MHPISVGETALAAAAAGVSFDEERTLSGD